MNRLELGDSIAIPLEVTAETSGLEHLPIIAVRGEGLPVDFAALAQPTIELARQGEVTRGVPAARGWQSPLGRLLQNAVYGQGGSRSMRRRESQDSLALAAVLENRAGSPSARRLTCKPAAIR